MTVIPALRVMVWLWTTVGHKQDRVRVSAAGSCLEPSSSQPHSLLDCYMSVLSSLPISTTTLLQTSLLSEARRSISRCKSDHTITHLKSIMIPQGPRTQPEPLILSRRTRNPLGLSQVSLRIPATFAQCPGLPRSQDPSCFLLPVGSCFELAVPSTQNTLTNTFSLLL